MGDENNKAAIEALASLGSEELARKLLAARNGNDRISKEYDEKRKLVITLELTICAVVDLLWVEVRETEPTLSRGDVISIANRARELLRFEREQREMPF